MFFCFWIGNEMKRGVRVNGGDCCYQDDRSTQVYVASSSSSSSLRFPAGSFTVAAVGDSACAHGGGGGMNYIEHPVSKMDTLAGVAIRYGVEVSDIKRINGLVSDFQMFALKTLQIPLPGRHPPSPTLANGFDSHGGNLQYAKLLWYKIGRSRRYVVSSKGFERSAHGEERGSHHPIESESESSDLFSKSSNPPLNPRRKCRSVVFMNLEDDGVLTQESKYYTNGDSPDSSFIRRRQKSESDFLRSPEMLLLKEDECSSGGFSPIGSKGLALRPNKAASRAIAVAESEASSTNLIAIEESSNSGCANNLSRVRRSSSTSNLQDSDSSTFTSLWPITRPIFFDGLAKPITGRRNKAALD